ncbi:MAG TPA: hypothetical protein VHO70_10305 [Chitinispirillaceae bacterium]|nr:hypothetical protein [Chitinispirillaceae bacterium]
MKNFLRLFVFIVFVLLPLSVFSRNNSKNATIFIDGNPETEGISPAASHVIEGEVVIIAVVAENMTNLHTYSFKCQFDTQIVHFNGAVAKMSPSSTAFLEKNNGSIAAFLSFPDTNCVEIAATLSGKDPTECVSGDGVIGFLSFVAKRNGNPKLMLNSARFVTPEGTTIPTEIGK